MSGQIAWIVSYPKSGNTWMRLLISSLAEGGREVDINLPFLKAGVATCEEFEEVFGMETGDLTEQEMVLHRPALHMAIAEDSDRPVAFRKVHDRYWSTCAGEAVFPASVSRIAVYLVRDPRDVAVSYSYHRDEDLDAVIGFMGDESAMLARPGPRFRPQLPQPLGSWSDHVCSWLDQKNIPVLAIRYEDLHRDPRGALEPVARELGFDHSAETISAAVESTRFSRLREQEERNGFRERRNEVRSLFFREGRTGGWRSVLSPAQARAIEMRHGHVMARLGYL